MGPALTELVVGDEAPSWQEAGFAVEDGRVTVGGIAIRLVGKDDPRGRGVLAWRIGDLDPSVGEIDGVPVDPPATLPSAPQPSNVHPNGTVGIDHVVVVSPDLGRTIDRLTALGIEPRRTRDIGSTESPRQQVFFWIGDTILELVGPVEPTGDGPARIYGLALTVEDIDRTAAELGARVGRVKDAVQPGRRITTLRHRDLDVSVPVAFMSAHVRTVHDDA